MPAFEARSVIGSPILHQDRIEVFTERTEFPRDCGAGYSGNRVYRACGSAAVERMTILGASQSFEPA